VFWGDFFWGRILLGPDLRSQLFMFWITCMKSLNSEILLLGTSFASTWLSTLTQLLKQCPLMNQQGHILTFPFQVTHPSMFLLAKDPPHVSPWASLNALGGELLMTLLLFFFLLPFLSSGSSSFLSILGVWVTLVSGVGAVKTDGSLSSNVPKQTCSMIDLKSMMESSTLLQNVAVMHSSNHKW
jgi:hypothetical protein